MRHAYPRATLPPLTHLILVVGKTKKQYCKIRSVSRACRTCLFSCRVRFTVYIPQWIPIGWNVAYDRLAFAVRSDARDVLVRQSNVFNQVTNVNVPVNIDFSEARDIPEPPDPEEQEPPQIDESEDGGDLAPEEEGDLTPEEEGDLTPEEEGDLTPEEEGDLTPEEQPDEPGTDEPDDDDGLEGGDDSGSGEDEGFGGDDSGSGEDEGFGGDDSFGGGDDFGGCLLYTSPSPRDGLLSRMPSSA